MSVNEIVTYGRILLVVLAVWCARDMSWCCKRLLNSVLSSAFNKNGA
jgi:hypothetical protein